MRLERYSVGRNRLASLVVATTLTLLGAACTSGLPPSMSTAKGRVPSSTANSTGASPGASSVLAQQGLLIPDTYHKACANEGVACRPGTTGQIPAVLKRSLHSPVLRPGQRCPATPGHSVNNSYFSGIALGTGLVRPNIAMEGDLLHGITVAAPTEFPGWLAFKTLWFSMPAY